MENLPRDKVLHFLMEGFKELAIPYLEHIIYVWDDKSPEFHNVLIQLYLERVQSLMKQYLNSLPEGMTLCSHENVLLLFFQIRQPNNRYGFHEKTIPAAGSRVERWCSFARVPLLCKCDLCLHLFAMIIQDGGERPQCFRTLIVLLMKPV